MRQRRGVAMGHAQNHQGADKFAGEDGGGKTPRRPPALMEIDLRHDPGDQRRQHQANAQAVDRHSDHDLHMAKASDINNPPMPAST